MSDDDRDRCLRDIAKRLDKLQSDLDELKQAWTQHVAEYGDLLKQTKVSADERIKLRGAILEKTIAGAVWAIAMFIGIAIWQSIKEHIK